MSKSESKENQPEAYASIHSTTVFTDPVSYLRSLGIECEIVAEAAEPLAA